ncbi:MAG: HdaA/DnaA family protein [Wenzhouxiangella sp.]
MSQHQIPLALKPPRRPGFDNFVAGDNRAVVETLRNGLEAGHWYYLGGPSGSGRSHLLTACFAAFNARGIEVAYAGMIAPANRRLLETLSARWVILDDIDAMAGVAEDEMRLFNALNRWRAERAGVLMSGCSRQGFKLPDLKSRLGQAAALRMSPLDEAALTELVRRLAREHEVILGRGAAEYLVSRSLRQPASLAYRMEQLAARALNERRTLSVPLVRELLSEDTVEA